MKTIVIHPDVIGYYTGSLHRPQKSSNASVIACAILLPAVALTSWALGRSSTPAPQAAPTISFAAPSAAAPTIDLGAELPVKKTTLVFADGALDLAGAVDSGAIRATFAGNGRERIVAQIENPGANDVTIKVSFGQMLQSRRGAVVVARDAQMTVGAGKSVPVALETLAVSSANQVGESSFQLSSRTAPRIDLLLAYAQEHTDFSPGALQTAVLALTENLPLSAMCKFQPTGADLPSRFDTTAFRVETADLLTALAVLREIGVRDTDLALTVDPQLKIEAMIDPTCRAAAMRYYRISAGEEWAYWKNELLKGDDGTRHYALFGIARFYPEIALQMLPDWAREKRTTQTLRLAAIQALADTQKPEALPILCDLVNELGRNTELGRTALGAAEYLEDHFKKADAAKVTIAFRNGGSIGRELVSK